MALRRLMSGWLIALAAVARAVASALERAAADQSAPAVDPVMAALVERYPDAPAHWLAFVAERMSQATDAVEFFSTSAESSAERVSVPESLTAITPGPMSTDATPQSEPPIAPGVRPARRREEVAVPSLAELASRSSEVWRRPSVPPNRPSRPIFARPAEAAATMAATPGNEAPTPASRPRLPLTAARAAPAIWPDRSPSDKVSPDMRPSDLDQPLAAPTPNGELSVEPTAAVSISTTPTPRPDAWSNDPPSMTGEAAREAAPGSHLVPTASKAVSETTPRGPFLSPPSPAPLPPKPSSREPTAGAAWPSPSDPTVVEAGVPDPRRGPARPLAAVRSAARRAIVQTMGALRPRVASASHHQVPASAPPPVSPSTIVRRPGRSTSPRAASKHDPASTEIRAPRAEGRETSAEATPWSPHRRTSRVDDDAARDEPSSARRPEPRAREFAPAFAPEPAPRHSLAARRASPAHGRTHAAASPSDDRWPSLPPSVLPPPPEVEAPAPRLHRLARDQEEGLWSA